MTFYSSRSAIESSERCPRRGYIERFWDGLGLRPRRKSISLITGGAVHDGLADIMMGKGIDSAIKSSNREFENESYHLDRELTSIEQFTSNEQIALAEALLRVFNLKLYPTYRDKYEILMVEKDLNCKFPNTDLVFESRPDTVIRHNETGDISILSFKTISQIDDRVDKNAAHDNQGISELWAVEQYWEYLREYVDQAILSATALRSTLPTNSLDKMIEWYKSRRDVIPKIVSGIKMIYLIKGKIYDERDWEGKETGKRYTVSPLIRGYRKIDGGRIEYAHSYYYSNPNNKSGQSRLGKGWEPFNVWEDEAIGGVEGWIQMLADGEVQPEAGDILLQQLYSPPEWVRSQDEIESWIRQKTAKEERISDVIKIHGVSRNRVMLDEYFEQYHASCHYPTDCPFAGLLQKPGLCYSRQLFDTPIESGEYVYRESHHPLEAAELQDLLEKMQGLHKPSVEVSQDSGEVLEIEDEEL